MSSISVLMSLYDKENCGFFHLCLKSLVEQSRAPEEVVIVLDGPVNNNLKQVISEFSPLLPLKIVKLEKNSGLAIALNEGLKACSGDIVARMDTDDICYPNRLELQEKFLLSRHLDIVGTAASVINLNGEVTGVRVNPASHENIVSMLWCNPMIHPSTMFIKESIFSIGAYDTTLRRRQDYELWFRAVHHGLKLGNLNEQLLYYRYDHHTLQKQSPKLAWMQGVIGFKGSVACKLGLLKGLCCFIPFIRALMPLKIQLKLVSFMKRFDSRVRS